MVLWIPVNHDASCTRADTGQGTDCDTLNHMKKPLIVLIVALGLMRPAWADFQDGLAAYERGDYQTALREWRLLAERGVAEAQYSAPGAR